MAIYLDPQSALPLFARIAQAVRDQIARGELAPGASLPTVRELAQTLGVNPNTVNRAYALLRQEGLVEGRLSQGTRVAAPPEGNRQGVRTAELNLLVSGLIGQALSRGYALPEVEAALVGQWARWREEGAPRENDAPADQILGIGSHDLSLELFMAQFQQQSPDCHIRFVTVGSLAGLMTLARGETHFAAAHLYDPAANDYNLPAMRRLKPGGRYALLTLVQRTQGLLVAAGNPKRLRTLRDLARAGVRFVNRQPGSGTRVLLDQLLKRHHIAPRQIRGYAREETTHIAVAAAVAGGAADAGLGIQAAARSLNLDFVPLAHERFELVLPAGSPLLTRFQALVRRPEFQAAVLALEGYDVRETGQVRYT